MTSSQKSHSNKKQEGQKKGKKGVISKGTKKGRSVTKSEQGEITETQFLPPMVWAVSSPVGGLVLETASEETYEEHCTALH